MTPRQRLLANEHAQDIEEEKDLARAIQQASPGMSWGTAMRESVRLLQTKGATGFQRRWAPGTPP